MEKTELLFYLCPEKYEFDASVISIKDANIIGLDSTAFYPKGGYQDADHGKIESNSEGSQVIQVFREDGIVYHQTESPVNFKIGQRVHGAIDIERRKYLSMLHTCQHVISRIVFNNFEINTKRCEMSEKGGEVIFHQGILPDWICTIEHELREVAKRQLSIEQRLSDGFREVYIDNFDLSPCGGTHLGNTVGLTDSFIIGIDNNKIFFDGGNVGLERLIESHRVCFALKQHKELDGDIIKSINELYAKVDSFRSRKNDYICMLLKTIPYFPDYMQNWGHMKICYAHLPWLSNRDINKHIGGYIPPEGISLSVFLMESKCILISSDQKISSISIIESLKSRGLALDGGGNAKMGQFSYDPSRVRDINENIKIIVVKA